MEVAGRHVKWFQWWCQEADLKIKWQKFFNKVPDPFKSLDQISWLKATKSISELVMEVAPGNFPTVWTAWSRDSGPDSTFDLDFANPCPSAHSMTTKKMNFGNHYEGFCYPSNTISLQVKFGSKVSRFWFDSYITWRISGAWNSRCCYNRMSMWIWTSLQPVNAIRFQS